jgi:hypothetical protein
MVSILISADNVPQHGVLAGGRQGKSWKIADDFSQIFRSNLL